MNSNSWWIGFITGVVTVLIGFGLTVLWDMYKYNRDIKSKEDVIISAVKEELDNNLTLLERNKELISQEIQTLDEKNEVVTPLSNLETGFWDLIKINLPEKLTSKEILLQIRGVALLTGVVNEQIRSRENYRVHNGAMSNYHRRLKIYDGIILESTNKLMKLLKEIQPSLQEDNPMRNQG